MSKTRNLSDLLDANGDVKSTALDNVPPSDDASALTSGTLPDARLSTNVTQNSSTQTLTNKTIDASSNTLSNIPNSALTNSSITINGTATALGSSISVATTDASTLTSGTLDSARLPTVPTTKGGTGLTSIGTADQVLKVNSGGTALEFGEAGGGGNYVRRIYTSPATWSKPADVQAVKVSVWGGGGSGGSSFIYPNGSRVGGHGGTGGWATEYIPEASITGPVSVTAGPGTNSFGGFVSATGGGNGSPAPGNENGNPGSNGSGSGGDLNFPGEWYNFRDDATGTMGFGAGGTNGPSSFGPAQPGQPAQGWQMGGGGGGGNNGQGGSGATGGIIVEEYY